MFNSFPYNNSFSKLGGVLNSQVAVVTVPESQLFAVQQSQQADSVQQETDLTSEDDITSVTGSVSNVSDPNGLTINVTLQPHSGSLSEDGVLPEGVPSSTPGDPKVAYSTCIEPFFFKVIPQKLN